jgi:hypothetical protein
MLYLQNPLKLAVHTLEKLNNNFNFLFPSSPFAFPLQRGGLSSLVDNWLGKRYYGTYESSRFRHGNTPLVVLWNRTIGHMVISGHLPVVHKGVMGDLFAS